MPGCLVVAKVTNGLKGLFGFVCRVRDGYSLDLPEKKVKSEYFPTIPDVRRAAFGHKVVLKRFKVT